MTDPQQRHVRLSIWGVPPRRIGSAIARMGTSRLALRSEPHLVFSKLLGTAKPTTFTPRATDPRHWALLTVWDDEQAADAFDTGRLARSWSLAADETLRIAMTPLSSTGQWSGTEPFGDPQPRRHDGPVAAITRARIRPARMREFWAASERVATALRTADGLVIATGIGEAPVGLQGTFSLWESAAAMSAFAYQRPEHTEVITRTPIAQWYAEELFARFAVHRVSGSFVGTSYAIDDSASTNDSASIDDGDPTGNANPEPMP